MNQIRLDDILLSKAPMLNRMNELLRKKKERIKNQKQKKMLNYEEEQSFISGFRFKLISSWAGVEFAWSNLASDRLDVLKII